ncbi:MAG TPA: nickel pincer cofactor biosynthesis protein LarC [Longimicrobiales bacterium]|nr:nickel pincer cofactor biosynthesis protein LarC [Longimicrobiales bacterium]
MPTLIFDPFAGISGDMILGALVDLGYPEGRLRELAGSLGAADGSVIVGTELRRGISCRAVRFQVPPERRHRHLPDMIAVLEGGALEARGLALARAVFERLARAEAAVHGIPPERVHFHEVGGLDAILDIGCAADALVHLGVDACYARPVAIGRGWIDMEHGAFPLPAPATAKLLEGLEVRETRWEGECTTPTGAAILAEATAGRPPPERFVLRATGYGAGSRDPEDRPNCLRLMLCEVSSAEDDGLFIVQSDLDDMTPEYVPSALAAMRDAGALDVVTAPVGMKKGRTGLRIEALAPSGALEPVLEALFTNTTTIGARYWSVGRRALAREEKMRAWHGSSIRVKGARLPDGSVRAKPEFDDVVRAAHQAGLPPFEVLRALDRADAEGGAGEAGSTPADIP